MQLRKGVGQKKKRDEKILLIHIRDKNARMTNNGWRDKSISGQGTDPKGSLHLGHENRQRKTNYK